MTDLGNRDWVGIAITAMGLVFLLREALLAIGRRRGPQQGLENAEPDDLYTASLLHDVADPSAGTRCSGSNPSEMPGGTWHNLD